jgi:hypothetical protein
VAAGDTERRATDLHVRSLDEPFVDGIAQIDIGKAVSPDIAHGRDAGLERHFRIASADQSALGHGGGELVIGIEVRLHGQVSVHVDHAGQ